VEEYRVFRKFCLAAAATAAFLAAGPAAAANAEDVRCFMLSNLFAQKAATDQAKKLAQASGFYYLGKLQGMSDAELRRLIAEQQKQITQATASRDMQTCAKAVQSSGMRIQSFAPPQPAPAPAQRR
jgi:hypothetical protein